MTNQSGNGSGQVGSSGFRADQQYSTEDDPTRQKGAADVNMQDPVSGQSLEDGGKHLHADPTDKMSRIHEEQNDSATLNFNEKNSISVLETGT